MMFSSCNATGFTIEFVMEKYLTFLKYWSLKGLKFDQPKVAHTLLYSMKQSCDRQIGTGAVKYALWVNCLSGGIGVVQ